MKRVLIVTFFSVAIYFLKKHMNGCSYQSDIRLDGKVVIVTGANTGIGKVTAKDIVQRGAKVYMACRSLERGQEALDDVRGQTGVNKDQLVLMKLDLASLASVREFAAEFKRRETNLEILVNNAGLLSNIYNRTFTDDGFESTFGVNHLGHFLLTVLLVDPLVTAAPSRVVTVSSDEYKNGNINFDDLMADNNYGCTTAYSQSKLANVLFARKLSARLEGTGVTSYSLHPGAIFTDIGRNMPGYNIIPLRYLITLLCSPIVKDVWHGTRTTVFCAIEAGLEKYTGQYFSDCALEEMTSEALDDDVAERLWDVSAELVHLQPKEIHPVLI